MTRETLTYIGRRTGRNDKLMYVYLLEGEELYFGKALKPASVGAHIEADIETLPDGHHAVRNSAYGSGRTVGEDMTRYAALDAAAIGASEARKAASKHDPLVEALAPIREAYMNASPIERAALLTNVIRKITTYS